MIKKMIEKRKMITMEKPNGLETVEDIKKYFGYKTYNQVYTILIKAGIALFKESPDIFLKYYHNSIN